MKQQCPFLNKTACAVNGWGCEEHGNPLIPDADFQALGGRSRWLMNSIKKQKQPCITMEYRPPFTVELQYFKDSGKYYSSGEYKTEKLQMYEIFAEVREMLTYGKRPGLVDGANEFHVLVNVPNHPHAHPALFIAGSENSK